MTSTSDDDIWHIARAGQQADTLTAEEMRKFVELGYLKPDDLLWRAGMIDWQPAALALPAAFGHEPAEDLLVPDHEDDHRIETLRVLIGHDPASAGTAFSIADAIGSYLGRHNVFCHAFRDRVEPDAIPDGERTALGSYFDPSLDWAFCNSDVYVPVVGQQALSGHAGGEGDGSPTLDVLLADVSRASSARLRVVPVFVDGVSPQDASKSKQSANIFGSVRSISIGHERFKYDLDELLDVLVPGRSRERPNSLAGFKTFKCVNCRKTFAPALEDKWGSFTCDFHPSKAIRTFGNYDDHYQFSCCGRRRTAQNFYDSAEPESVPGCLAGYHETSNLKVHVACSSDMAEELLKWRMNNGFEGDLVSELTTYGLRVTISKRDMHGMPSANSLAAAEAADVLVVVCTQAGFVSSQLHVEVDLALRTGKVILPFSLQPVILPGLEELNVLPLLAYHVPDADPRIPHDGQTLAWYTTIEDELLRCVARRNSVWRWQVTHGKRDSGNQAE